MTYAVTPNPKVRMTRRDTWGNQNVRPAVAKWRAFRDRIQELGVEVKDGDIITFCVEMPASWPKKKRDALRGTPHRAKPDLDNLLGGLFDAAMPKGDQHIAECGQRKIWADVGAIEIRRQLP